jgi:response regulator RpfG family c-di-GMP phosphodiesterase
MDKILIIDDDQQMLNLHKLRLGGSYEVISTDNPEEALELALEHKPSAILMDLMMPKFSGFELCQSLHSLSYTSMIPIFVITGESAAKYKEHCVSLGAREFFEKPVDYNELKKQLAAEIEKRQADRRMHVRVRIRVILKLRGTDAEGKAFNVTTHTENISAGGFLCPCAATLLKGEVVEVFLSGEHERFAGKARVVRRDSPGAPWQNYAFAFTEVTSEWILQAK